MSGFQGRRIAVIGAGPMGLMVALEFLKKGAAVDIYEYDDRIGGMSATFDFDGLAIERYYHFICGPDQPMFDLLSELGLSDRLRWVETKMGYYFNGRLFPWGTPQALLSFPGLDLVTKLRYAAMVMRTKGVSDWRELDRVNVIDWLKRWLGEKGYNSLWKSLFELKFHEYTNSISAAWLGTRIKRVGLSRKNIFKELLGYLEGGSDVLLQAMDDKIKKLGGRIFLKAPVQQIVAASSGKISGIVVNGEHKDYDTVVSTVPIQYIPRLAPQLPEKFRKQIDSIANIGVACVILKLKHRITENFWVNINDPNIGIPGVIEYSNLNPVGGVHILYAPFYMPTSHAKYRQPDQDFISETTAYLKRLNPQYSSEWILSSRVSRYEFAQTVCPPGFYDMLPSMKTPLAGLWMADTAYYYPEDRSISESVRMAKVLVDAICRDSAS